MQRVYERSAGLKNSKNARIWACALTLCLLFAVTLRIMIASFTLFRIARTPDFAFRVIAAANVLFFASFLAVALFASTKAHADDAAPVACVGHNLLETLPVATLAKINAEAAATKNGEGRLWKIEKAGLKPSYLFGTMHMTDPRVIDLTPQAKTAYDGADTVVIETTEILDEAKASQSLLAKPDLMMFTDATTLSSLVDPKDLPVFEKGMVDRGMPLAAINKMKPWMIMGIVALPACEMARKNSGAPFLDIKLAKDAQSAGKKIEGLETMLEQVTAINSLPMKMSVQNLVETIKLGSKVDDVMETMIVLYTEGKIGAIMPLAKNIATDTKISDADYNDFEEKLINIRNQTMATRADKILEQGNAFIAVGAMHLVGDKGLVEKFRAAGYTVTAAGM